MSDNLATCSIFTTDLERLDPDSRAARLESMKAAVAKAATRNLENVPGSQWASIEVAVETSGAVTSVVARNTNPWVTAAAS
jgi:hypothetical protein